VEKEVAKKLPKEEEGFISPMVRLTATNKLLRTVKKMRNLPIACNGVKPLPGVLSIRINNCSARANQAMIAIINLERLENLALFMMLIWLQKDKNLIEPGAMLNFG
ncbi:MAG TPA: hypothetical protein VK588_05510, partial [Chitinophagaceae bacterium]|nr:hypothetical protein [Chitinophagaceae bacterium]